MNNDLAQKAISSALKGNWKEAIALNKEILKKKKEDVDALNRLAKAYIETGSINNAKSTARKTLRIDPFNKIATKSLEKWKNLKKKELLKKSICMPQEQFLEEPGKTRISSLINLGHKKVLVKLDSGEEVNFKTTRHRVSIATNENEYIGRLPDDVAARIGKCVKVGYDYQFFIKSIDSEGVKVFIREVKRSPKLKDSATFSTEKVDYMAHTPPELVHK